MDRLRPISDVRNVRHAILTVALVATSTASPASAEEALFA